MIIDLSNKLEDIKFSRDQGDIRNKQLDSMVKDLSQRNTQLSKDIRAYKEQLETLATRTTILEGELTLNHNKLKTSEKTLHA